MHGFEIDFWWCPEAEDAVTDAYVRKHGGYDGLVQHHAEIEVDDGSMFAIRIDGVVVREHDLKPEVRRVLEDALEEHNEESGWADAQLREHDQMLRDSYRW